MRQRPHERSMASSALDEHWAQERTLRACVVFIQEVRDDSNLPTDSGNDLVQSAVAFNVWCWVALTVRCPAAARRQNTTTARACVPEVVVAAAGGGLGWAEEEG